MITILSITFILVLSSIILYIKLNPINHELRMLGYDILNNIEKYEYELDRGYCRKEISMKSEKVDILIMFKYYDFARPCLDYVEINDIKMFNKRKNKYIYRISKKLRILKINNVIDNEIIDNLYID